MNQEAERGTLRSGKEFSEEERTSVGSSILVLGRQVAGRRTGLKLGEEGSMPFLIEV